MFGNLTLTTIVLTIVAILVSLTIHEMVHAWVGYRLGDDTAAEEGRITLNPLAHIDPFMTVLLPIITIVTFGAPILAAKPVPFNPARVKWDEYGAALIAVAGPLSNLLLAAVAILLTNQFGAALIAGDNLLGQFIAIFISLNVALFVFNLIPIPPLDGSRVLYAFAPEPVRNLMERIEPFGLFVVFGLVILGFGSFIGGWIQAVQNFLLALL